MVEGVPEFVGRAEHTKVLVDLCEGVDGLEVQHAAYK